MSWLAYPRLSASETHIRVEEIRRLADSDPRSIGSLAAPSHPRAAPVATGARLATVEDIEQTRARVMGELSRWDLTKPIKDTVGFDVDLGRALVSHLHIHPADAAHSGTWAFLAAVVFPDVAWARYPGLHEDRFYGTRQVRNVLRRSWTRHSVVGDLQEAADNPLGEDELTALFERTALARNRRLVRALARAILQYEGTARMAFTRDLLLRATALTGTYLLDVVDESAIYSYLRSMLPNHFGVTAGATHPVLVDDATPHHVTDDRELPPAHRVSGSVGSSDLVRDFHHAMLRLCREINQRTGARPDALYRLVIRRGGIEAARHEVGASEPSAIFDAMSRLGDPGLSVEGLVVDSRFEGLFTDELVNRARSRLREANRSD